VQDFICNQFLSVLVNNRLAFLIRFPASLLLLILSGRANQLGIPRACLVCFAVALRVNPSLIASPLCTRVLDALGCLVFMPLLSLDFLEIPLPFWVNLTSPFLLALDAPVWGMSLLYLPTICTLHTKLRCVSTHHMEHLSYLFLVKFLLVFYQLKVVLL